MTLTKITKSNGDVLDDIGWNGIQTNSGNELHPKTLSISGVSFTSDSTTGYVYWTAGNIFYDGSTFTVAASNSSADWRDKQIIATLSGGAATISSIANTVRIQDETKVLLGYCDPTSGALCMVNQYATWSVLADVTLGSASATLSSGTFAAMKMLNVVAYVTMTADNQVIYARFNNDSGANYQVLKQRAAGVAMSVITSNNQTAAVITDNATAQTGRTMTITMAMGNITTLYKDGITTHSQQNASITTSAFEWVNNAAQITRIDIYPGASTFTAGSRIVVFGR